MTVDEALGQPGEKVQAWDLALRDAKRALSIFRVGPNGTEKLAAESVLDGERDAMTADLVARGAAPAQTDSHCDFVWVARPDGGISVYSSKSRVFDTRGDQAQVSDPVVPATPLVTVRKREIAKIIAFAADDYVARGVKAELTNGKYLDLVVESSPSAQANPTYGKNELLVETEWCMTIATLIARWVGLGGAENQIESAKQA